MTLLAALVSMLLAALPAGATLTPEGVIAAAVRARVGEAVTVRVRLVDAVEGAFASATPDPLARTGRVALFSLTPATPGARPVRVRAEVEVVAPHVVATAAILRGHAVAEADVAVVDGPVVGLALKKLPALADVVGQPALRPIAAGQVIEPGFVAVRRAVQAGDTVTALAIVGAVQVSASLVAADAGDPGDVVRVVNPATRRSLRARVIEPGIVEVLRERR